MRLLTIGRKCDRMVKVWDIKGFRRAEILKLAYSVFLAINLFIRRKSNMNHKIRKCLAVSAAAVSLCCFSACGKHEHSYVDGWFYDENTHWRIATCDDMNGQKDKEAMHNFVDGFCTLCECPDPNYVAPSEDPGSDDPDPDEDDPGTEEPKEDPELPDDDPENAERPKPPEGGEEDPVDPDDEPLDDPLDDSYYDSFYLPESEYTWGQSSTEGKLKYTELLKEGTLSGYAVATSTEKSSESEVTIPKTYQNLPVLMVDKEGFSDCASLTKMTLPEGLLFIGEGAFKGCTSLKSVVIPSSAWLISREAFSGCNSLSEATLPEGVRDIRYAAFEGCAIGNLTIPNSVHSIASRAFFGCKISEVTFGTGVRNVGGQAFYGCGVSRVNISDLKAWCDVTFVYDNSNPLIGGASLYINGVRETKIEIPEGCGVKQYSFSGCASIEEVTIPSSAGIIGEGAFTKCYALHTVNFREGAYEIEEFAFGYCYKLTELILPNSMKTIRRDAIYNCTNLSKIVLGKGISLLEMDAFTMISNSPKFYYRGSEADWGKIVKNSSWTTNMGKIEYNYTDQ